MTFQVFHDPYEACYFSRLQFVTYFFIFFSLGEPSHFESQY